MESLRMWIATFECIKPVFFRRGRLAEYMQPKCRDSIGSDHSVKIDLIIWTTVFRIMAAKTLTKSVSLTDSNVQILLEG